MIVINNISDKKFSFNGVNYYKNFTPKVVGNKIEILNTYDSDIRLTDYPTLFSEFELNGNTYASVSSLQDALLPTVFTRDGLGGGGANILNDLTDVNTVDLEDGDALTWDADSNNWINKHNVIQIDVYENIPLKEGVYSIYIYNEGGSAVFPSEYSLELPTNVFRYSDNTTILSPNFMQYSDDQTIVKREFRINDSGYVLTDTFYDINGVEIGTVLPQETTPKLNVSYSFYLSVKYVSDLYDNSYIRLNKPFGVESLNPIFGNINIKLNELNYENGLLSFGFDFPEYIKIEEASLIYGNFSTQNFKIGLIESDTENKLGILDYSGILENDLNKNEVVLNVVYTETISSLASKRIKPFNNNNTLVNVVNLEQEVPHSNAMTLTFEEVYGVFNGVVYNASSPNIEDLFNVKIIETERQSVNADIYFSAGSGMGFLKTFELQDSYGIVPLGSNDLIRQDVTDAIDKFPSNYIAVTSRSETDNDGTDPLGTSYGFGVEFNEPTLSADLTGQGLTDWGGSSEHQQSPATAIVSGKLKYIKDQTGAPWDVIREACRQTASNANSYNIYRGFGKIDTSSAIALIPTLLNTRSQELAEYYEATTVMPLELKYEDKSLNTLVNKRDLEDNSQTSLVGYRETGTPEDGDLIVDIGDFDDIGSGTKIEVDVANEEVNITAYVQTTVNSRLSVLGDLGLGGTKYFPKVDISTNDVTSQRAIKMPDSSGTLATEEFVDTSLGNFFDSSIVALNRRVIDNGATLDRKLRFVQEDLDAEPTTPTLMWVNSAHKNNDLYSVLPIGGSGDFNIATQSNKCVVGEDGVLTEVLAGRPAYSYQNGKAQLLVEEESTNLIANSENVNASNWILKRNAIYNVLDAKGGTNAINLTSDSNNQSVFRLSGVSITMGMPYTVSIFIKSVNVTGSVVLKNINNSPLDITSMLIENEYVRISSSDISLYTSGFFLIDLQNSGDSIDVCFPMTEQSSFVSSYITTGATTATRLADNITVNTPAGITEITETINGVDNVIATIPTTYTMPNGLIDKIAMR